MDYFGSVEGEVMERSAGPKELDDPHQLGEIAHSLIEESNLIILGIDTEDIEGQMPICTLLEQNREIVKHKAEALVEHVSPKRSRFISEIPREVTFTQATQAKTPAKTRKITSVDFFPKSRHMKSLISKSTIQYSKETPIFMRPPTGPYDMFEVLTSKNVVENLSLNNSQGKQVQSIVQSNCQS